MTEQLDALLELPPCTRCDQGRVRPIDIFDGVHLTFRCSNRRCTYDRRVKLPSLSRTVLYLDTSTVSHMARALKRGEDTASPYVRLYQALRRATARNVIACPGSSIVESEAELSQLADAIVKMSRQLGDPGLSHELEVKESQLFRAYGRFVGAEEPSLEQHPPRSDAFNNDLNEWHSMFSVRSNIRPSAEFAEERRNAKVQLVEQVTAIYSQYADENLSLEEIAEREAAGFGLGILGDAQRTFGDRVARATGAERSPFVWLPTTFDKLAYAVQKRRSCSAADAAREASEFLRSRHVALLPMAQVGARMHAGLAMMLRGPMPRKPKASDLYDVEHLATYLPYVDVFICDRFIADLANQGHVNLPSLFDVSIRSLAKSEIDGFIAWLDNLVTTSPVAALAERVYGAIWAGGYHQEFAAYAEQYMKNVKSTGE